MAQDGPFDHHRLDPVIHSKKRLAIMVMLAGVGSADFAFVKQQVASTDGTLGAHLRKLENAGYISVEKLFVDRKPRTRYSMTSKGRAAFSASGGDQEAGFVGMNPTTRPLARSSLTPSTAVGLQPACR